ncbi:protein fam86a [Aspergillus tubingensis]|nr:protein fam86a [Aspergillus tubingensis]GLA98455.1 protein fam86a [Aspergillus tubingensis]GLB23404.1 protein fam86a [Aspergillus tubingensis]
MSLSLLTAQYFQQLDPHLLTFPEDNHLLHPTTQETIYNTLFSESNAANDHHQPLPPPAYRTRVLKRLITKLESLLSNPEEDEINESLLEEYSTLLTLPKPSSIEQAQQLTYITYTAPPEEDDDHDSETNNKRRTILTSESRSAIITAGTTGHRTWEAALHLATYLSSTAAGKAHIAGKKVLELGAGTGMVSMFCARYLQPEVVVATDRELGLMRQIRDCAGRNGLVGEKDDGGVFKGWIWEWGRELSRGSGEDDDDDDDDDELQQVGDGEKVEFDVALGADLIYDIDLVPLLVQTVKSLFEKYAVKEFLISATLRNERTFGAFLDACEESALKVERVPFESPAEEHQRGFFHSTVIPIRTYRITA